MRLISEIPVRVLKQRATEQPVYQSSQAFFDYLSYSMRGLKTEVFKVIHLNARNQIIQTLELFKGSVSGIPVCPREIVESAIKYRAVSMIFAHNHPSGDPTPSKSDRQLTRDLVFIGSVIQIRVLDHIIVGDNSHFSFADEGLIQKYEDGFLMLRMRAGA
jgi:DNA repair protein RadC